MKAIARWGRIVALVGILALVAAACGGDDAGPGGGDVKTGAGITTEPCPGSTHTDRGCIYLGVLSDLTVGPFRALAVPLTDGQKAFWKRVNDGNGIGGKYDVDITKYTRDNKYNPQEHVAQLRQILPNILMLAQSLGTPPTIAARDIMEEENLVASPASWWSGWSFEDLVIESGHNYCTEAMNGLDWFAETHGKPDTLMAVHYPGDYGGDSAAGVAKWATANDVAFPKANDVQTAPNATAGTQDAPVAAILRVKPDVVVLATGPAEMAEIVGKAAAGGYKGRFVGSSPTYNPAVLASAAKPAILGLYNFVGPWGPWGTNTAAHNAMKAAAGSKLPANEGYTSGWIWSYPVKAVLEKAFELGDLTREGVRAAVEQTTVDYEGALPAKKYSGDANTNVVRQSLIGKADEAAPLGSSVVKDFFVGPTAKDFSFTEPCQKL
ncbi:MAG TPA: ABC transporter substrate-binding protein [Actinomycetota bacterium]|nr:ABC transporter substrate-binding protein [Actinomycetota bacterium]